MPPKELEQLAGKGESRTLTARELLWYWGASRRSWAVIEEITRDVRALGLKITPSIVDVSIDEMVTVTAAGNGERIHTPNSPDESTQAEPSLDGSSERQIRMKMFWIPAATRPVEMVNPSESLKTAITRMFRHDYSQLAVMRSPRAEPRAISWESIAKSQLGSRGRETSITDASVVATCVQWDDDLLGAIPKIIHSGFVFVRDRDRTLRGIVTTTDLSQQFKEVAQPFLLLGEIERALRVLLDHSFTVEELEQVRANYEKSRPVLGARDLTIGEMQRLLEEPQNFSRFGWAMDRSEFVAAFEEVRTLRNEVMHFSPDAVGHAELRILSNFQSMLQRLAPDLLA